MLSSRVTMNDRTPARTGQRISVAEVVNQFLTVKEQAVATGTLSPRTFVEYHDVCARLITHFGRRRPVATLRPVDLIGLKNALAQGKNGRIGIERLGKLIAIVRLVFRYGANNGLHAP